MSSALGARAREPGGRPEGRRVLLVEFAVAERFHRAIAFPFLFGWAKERGLPIRWLRFGVGPKAAEGPSGGVELGAEDTDSLRQALEAWAPEAIVFSAMPSAPLLSALDAALGAASLHCSLSSAARPAAGERSVELLDPRTAAFDTLVGLDEPAIRGVGIFQRASPDWSYEPANALAARLPALPFLLAGDECTYGRSLKRNEFFDGLPLEARLRKGGCTFCMRPESAGAWSRHPLELLRLQLEAVARTCPRSAGRLQLRLVGESILGHLEAVIGLVRASSLPPSDLLLDARADLLLDALETLREALPSLEGSGHRVQLALIGIESFSGKELLRLNKGIDSATNVRAIRALMQLEREFGGVFDFREHGGLSFITFTPWTCPEELDLNLTLAAQLGITGLAGKLLTGRVRLYEALPLTAAARRDGLLCDRYEDPLLDTARQNFYEPELPWRFEEPTMQAICSTLLRIDAGAGADESDAIDPLSVGVQRLLRQLGTRDEVALATRIVREAMRLGGSSERALEAETLLAALLDSPERGASPGGPQAERWERADSPSEGPLGAEAGRSLRAEKPVCKLEPVQASELEAWLARPELRHARARERPAAGEVRAWEIFYGEDEGDVLRALECAERLDSACASSEWAQAATEMGELLGYPPCCARSFARDASRMRDHYAWMHIARRVEIPGEVPWELNPSCDVLTEFVPCSLRCEAAIDRARRIGAALERQDGAAFARLRAEMQNPQLMLFASQGDRVELLPEQEPGPRFRYRAGATRGAGADLASVIEADELVLEGECVLLLRGGRRHASLSGRAFLWWHQEVFQAELWAELTRYMREVPLEQRQLRGPEAGATEAPRWALRLMELLSRLRERGTDFGGFRLDRWAPRRRGELELRLVSERAQITLQLSPSSPSTPSLHVAGPFAVGYPSERPLDSAEKQRGARIFARKLAHILRPRP